MFENPLMKDLERDKGRVVARSEKIRGELTSDLSRVAPVITGTEKVIRIIRQFLAIRRFFTK